MIHRRRLHTLRRGGRAARRPHALSSCRPRECHEPNERGSGETGAKLKPWTKQAAKYKLRAEAILRDVPGLNLVVLRAATIYGPGDVYGLSPRVICAAVYKHLNEKMKFAWDSKLRYNTVHVRDVATACWHCALIESPQPVYNLADGSDSSQGSIAQALERCLILAPAFTARWRRRR